MPVQRAENSVVDARGRRIGWRAMAAHFTLSIGENVKNAGTSELRIYLCQQHYYNLLGSAGLHLSNHAKLQSGKPQLS